MENKTPYHIKAWFIILASSIIALAILVTSLRTDALAGVSVGDYMIEKAIVANKEIIWSQADEDKRIALEKAKEKKPVKVTPKVEKKQEKPKEVKIDTSFDLDRLARAVAIAETGNCTKGYWPTHNNCHWIKSWNTYKCPWTPKGKMCKFKDKEESFTAFKVIWSKWYKTMPTHTQAVRWTGADSSTTWRKHVLHYYYN